MLSLSQILTLIRIPDTLGNAILHYESTGKKASVVRRIDPLDSLLGGPSQELRPISHTSTSEIKIRLEYDDSIIGPESARAYLEHLRYHIESPDGLIN
jgi:hypothetical protein